MKKTDTTENLKGLTQNDVVGGRYRIVREIGHGGMGIVYAVEDMKLGGKLQAMKVTPMRDSLLKRSEEARTLMKLSHPCLPVITDYFPPEHPGGVELLIMDYIDGHTLADRMEQAHLPLTIGDIVMIGLHLCSALIYLHNQPLPIIHRDLKPSNVMLDAEGHLKLIDFGISRQFKQGQLADTLQLGTLGFAAPEQLAGIQSDVRTDIYSLGALLYYLATNGEVIKRVLNVERTYASIDGLPRACPLPLKETLERMLQPNPSFRYQTMKEVETELKRCHSSNRTSPRSQSSLQEARLEIKLQEYTSSNRISVLSLSSGAGATWISITLAYLLAEQGKSVTAAEFDKLLPEWEELLPNREQGDSSLIEWITVPSNGAKEESLDVHRFAQRLQISNSQFQIIDFSSAWQHSSSHYWLRQSQHIIVMVDPVIAKWQPDQLKILVALQHEIEKLGGQMHWLANKDMKFKYRNQWLNMIPYTPISTIPYIPQEYILESQWRGTWLTDHPTIGKTIRRSLRDLLKVIQYTHP